MSGQNDPFAPQQPASWDDKGQPMMVYPQPSGAVAQASTEAVVAASSRRSAALMWMGAFLGATVITAVFLGIVYLDTSNDLDEARALNVTHAAKLEANVKQLSEMDAYGRYLRNENRELTAENVRLSTIARRPPRPAANPPSRDPFSDVPLQ